MDQFEELIHELGALYRRFSDVFFTLDNLGDARDDSSQRYERHLKGMIAHRDMIIQILQKEKNADSVNVQGKTGGVKDGQEEDEVQGVKLPDHHEHQREIHRRDHGGGGMDY
jgi:hypothetical protein